MEGTAFAVAGFIALVVLVFGATFIPLVFGLNFARRKRELEHAERMRALELGRPSAPPPGTGDNRSLAYNIAFWIGAGVPIGVFGCAWLASQAVGFHEGMWLAAAIVGLGGVVGGTTLAVTVYRPNTADSSTHPTDSLAGAKPFVDEDAYDVVSAAGNPVRALMDQFEARRLNFLKNRCNDGYPGD